MAIRNELAIGLALVRFMVRCRRCLIHQYAKNFVSAWAEIGILLKSYTFPPQVNRARFFASALTFYTPSLFLTLSSHISTMTDIFMALFNALFCSSLSAIIASCLFSLSGNRYRQNLTVNGGNFNTSFVAPQPSKFQQKVLTNSQYRFHFYFHYGNSNTM